MAKTASSNKIFRYTVWSLYFSDYKSLQSIDHISQKNASWRRNKNVYKPLVYKSHEYKLQPGQTIEKNKKTYSPENTVCSV